MNKEYLINLCKENFKTYHDYFCSDLGVFNNHIGKGTDKEFGNAILVLEKRLNERIKTLLGQFKGAKPEIGEIHKRVKKYLFKNIKNVMNCDEDKRLSEFKKWANVFKEDKKGEAKFLDEIFEQTENIDENQMLEKYKGTIGRITYNFWIKWKDYDGKISSFVDDFISKEKEDYQPESKKQYYKDDAFYKDLLSKANLTALEIWRKSSWDKSRPFEPYLAACLKNAVWDEVKQLKGISDLKIKIAKFISKYKKENEGRELSTKEISTGTGLSEEVIRGEKGTNVLPSPPSEETAEKIKMVRNLASPYQCEYLDRALNLSPAQESKLLRMLSGLYEEKESLEVDIKGKSILVVEDDKTYQNIIKKTLLSLKPYVTIVGGYDEAVKKLVENDFDLVILDIMIPSKKGQRDERQKVDGSFHGELLFKQILMLGIPIMVFSNTIPQYASKERKDREVELTGAVCLISKNDFTGQDAAQIMANKLKYFGFAKFCQQSDCGKIKFIGEKVFVDNNEVKFRQGSNLFIILSTLISRKNEKVNLNDITFKKKKKTSFKSFKNQIGDIIEKLLEYGCSKEVLKEYKNIKGEDSKEKWKEFQKKHLGVNFETIVEVNPNGKKEYLAKIIETQA